MAAKRIEMVTESMFYTLMAFTQGERTGAEAAAFVQEATHGRVRLGPATLYTILGRFEEEGVLHETATQGRKRYYALTGRGHALYQDEIARMELCLRDAQTAGKGDSLQ